MAVHDIEPVDNRSHDLSAYDDFEKKDLNYNADVSCPPGRGRCSSATLTTQVKVEPARDYEESVEPVDKGVVEGQAYAV